MRLDCPPGILSDFSPVASQPFWLWSENIRWRTGVPETLGIISKTGVDRLKGHPAQRLFGVGHKALVTQDDAVSLIDLDANTLTPLTPTPAPAHGAWWFDDDDDIVVGGPQGGAVYHWDRDPANRFEAISGAPTGAVGGGILNRILVLLGVDPRVDPDKAMQPGPKMTVRWSHRFDFEEWTESDINVAGELQLEHGTEIVGGGVTSYGVVAWTDKVMAVLTETGNIDSVFRRDYVTGSRGLLANAAWCESDGQVWWLDEHRVLNVFDGGRPRQIVCPMRGVTLDAMDLHRTDEITLTSHEEYSEVIIDYIDVAGDARQMVYNWADQAWYPWRLDRRAFLSRNGTRPALAIDSHGVLFYHDLPAAVTGVPDLPHILGNPQGLQFAVPEPIDFRLISNLFHTGAPTDAAWRATRVHIAYNWAGSVHQTKDARHRGHQFTATLKGYGEADYSRSPPTVDSRVLELGRMHTAFRVGGKALQLSLEGVGMEHVLRFGEIHLTANPNEGK
jgi:hypothetical protein